MIFLTTQPLWVLGTLLGVATLLAMMGPIIVRRHMTTERLSTNNEVAGFKFATVGVLYAVLLGFAVIVVWEQFNDAEKAVVDEAGAAAAVYRLSDGIGGVPGTALRNALSDYLRIAIDEEWPAMEQGRSSPAATRALNGLYATLMAFHPTDLREGDIQSDILHQLSILTEERRARVVVATGIVPGVLWFVLLGGAVVTISFTFFFGTQNLRAQVMMTGMLSALILSALLVVIAIDHPFTGSVKVTPEPLVAVLADFAM